jgi:hypothetical protein
MDGNVFFMSRLPPAAYDVMFGGLELVILLSICLVIYSVYRMCVKTTWRVAPIVGAIAILMGSCGLLHSFAFGGVNISGTRSPAVSDLKVIRNAQVEYKKEHGRYANSFDALKLEGNPHYQLSPDLDRYYTYYLNDSHMDALMGMGGRLHVKPRNDRIYAVCEVHNLGYDEISIDYNGKLELLHSFDYWPIKMPD